MGIQAGTDRGWRDFGRQFDADATIIIVLLTHGDTMPAWPVPSHLQMDRLLGAGSYGSVRQAWDTHAQRRVAVKQVLQVFGNASDAKRILREIAILSQLQHPNIVGIFDVIEPPPPCGLVTRFNHVYICMEFCDTDLKQVCKSTRGVSLPEVRRLFHTLCMGLNYLHVVGVCHRDLKPANCLANRDCTVKICDFNLARAVEEEKDCQGGDEPPLLPVLRRALTQKVCTAWYRSPEVVLSMDYTKAMDVWGAGCILAELVRALNTGGRVPRSRPLFRGSNCWPLSGDWQQGNQLDRIFDVLGTPFEDPHFVKLPLPNQEQLQRYPPRPGCGLRRKLPAEGSEQGLDLVGRMLRFFPQQRLPMEGVLKHEFFRRARRASTAETDAPDRQQLDLGFDDARVSTTQEIREEMERAVGRFHPVSQVPAAGDSEVTCICCEGQGHITIIGDCPLCAGLKAFS